MNHENHQSVQPQFYRFQIIRKNKSDSQSRPKVVGMAYLRDGNSMFTLRLWTFVNERFYLIASKHDPTRYIILSREPNQNPRKRSKFRWSVIGRGQADVRTGYIQLEFDLLDLPLFVSIYPETSAHASGLPDPAHFDAA